jgi:hypothetical protein
MANLKITNIYPNTRIALFKGTGSGTNFTDDDIIFHDMCVFQKNFELPKGEYCIRTIHKDMFFEHIDIDLVNEEEQVLTLKNKVDPSAKSVINYEGALLGYGMYRTKSKELVKERGIDLDQLEPINEELEKDLLVLLGQVKDEYNF